MKIAAIVLLLALVGAAVYWFFLRKPAPTQTPSQYVIPNGGGPQAKPGGVVNTIMATSTAGCQVAAKVAGIPHIGPVCEYTPINIALRLAPVVGRGAKAVGTATAHIATDVVGVPVAGAKAIYKGASSVVSSIGSGISSIF